MLGVAHTTAAGGCEAASNRGMLSGGTVRKQPIDEIHKITQTQVTAAHKIWDAHNCPAVPGTCWPRTASAIAAEFGQRQRA